LVLFFLPYFTRHNTIGPAIMMALVFPIALVGMVSFDRRDWYDN